MNTNNKTLFINISYHHISIHYIKVNNKIR